MSTADFEGYPFGEGVGEFARIEIYDLNFDQAAVELNKLATYLEDVSLPLAGALAIARNDMKERFDTEVAPDGTRWAALDPDYAKRKAHDKGFEHPILTRDGDLRKAATSAAAWTVTGDSIFFNTDGLPEYWRVHQEGSEDFGTVERVPEVKRNDYTGEFEPTGYHRHIGSGDSRHNIPPRPFIGLSSKAEDEILTLFDRWFAHGVEKAAHDFAVNSHGFLQQRVAGGRFGPRV